LMRYLNEALSGCGLWKSARTSFSTKLTDEPPLVVRMAPNDKNNASTFRHSILPFTGSANRAVSVFLWVLFIGNMIADYAIIANGPSEICQAINVQLQQLKRYTSDTPGRLMLYGCCTGKTAIRLQEAP
jgi:hypothetical protein